MLIFHRKFLNFTIAMIFVGIHHWVINALGMLSEHLFDIIAFHALKLIILYLYAAMWTVHVDEMDEAILFDLVHRDVQHLYRRFHQWRYA